MQNREISREMRRAGRRLSCLRGVCGGRAKITELFYLALQAVRNRLGGREASVVGTKIGVCRLSLRYSSRVAADSGLET